MFWVICVLMFTYTSRLPFLDNPPFPLIDWALKASTVQVASKTVHRTLPILSEKDYCFLWLRVWPFCVLSSSQSVPQLNECQVACDFASKATQGKRKSVSSKYLWAHGAQCVCLCWLCFWKTLVWIILSWTEGWETAAMPPAKPTFLNSLIRIYPIISKIPPK